MIKPPNLPSLDMIHSGGCSSITITLLLMLLSINMLGQTKAELKVSQKLFEGRWVNKKEKRHLIISYDGRKYVDINDWQGKWNQENNSIDAYKAWIEKGKLVMPESKTDLRCPYCEIIKKNNALLYRCMDMNTTDKKFRDSTLFVREKE